MIPCILLGTYHHWSNVISLSSGSWRWEQYFPSICWCLPSSVHGVITQKRVIPWKPHICMLHEPSTAQQGFRLSVMWHIVGRVVSSILKGCSALVFSVKQAKMSENSCSMAQHHSPEDLNCQQYCCANT